MRSNEYTSKLGTAQRFAAELQAKSGRVRDRRWPGRRTGRKEKKKKVGILEEMGSLGQNLWSEAEHTLRTQETFDLVSEPASRLIRYAASTP